jgi:hypothetical protein
VSAKAAAHLAEERWWWQRWVAAATDKDTVLAWAKGAVPDTVAEWWSILLLALVSMFVISCVDALAQGEEAHRHQQQQADVKQKQQ